MRGHWDSVIVFAQNSLYSFTSNTRHVACKNKPMAFSDCGDQCG